MFSKVGKCKHSGLATLLRDSVATSPPSSIFSVHKILLCLSSHILGTENIVMTKELIPERVEQNDAKWQKPTTRGPRQNLL